MTIILCTLYRGAIFNHLCNIICIHTNIYILYTNNQAYSDQLHNVRRVSQNPKKPIFITSSLEWREHWGNLYNFQCTINLSQKFVYLPNIIVIINLYLFLVIKLILATSLETIV